MARIFGGPTASQDMSAEELVGNSRYEGRSPDGTFMYTNGGGAQEAFDKLAKDDILVELKTGLQTAKLPSGGGATFNPNLNQVRITTPDSPDTIIRFAH